MSIQLGVIADDFTGATDIAGFIAAQGWKVVQLIGVPRPDTLCPAGADAVVIALKSRSAPAREAVSQALACLQWLRETAGARQFFFKYCSTFDSTPQGNIGPVSDALMSALGVSALVHCPALPQNGRTLVHGHLFVNGVPLHQSGMENHPVNPMRDAKVANLLAPQTPGAIGELNLALIQQGSETILRRVDELVSQGKNHIIADTLTVLDLDSLAQGLSDLPLLAGGSGLGGALAKLHPSAGLTAGVGDMVFPLNRKGVVLAGSCSVMTNRQVDFYRAYAPSLPLDVERCLEADADYFDDVADWTARQADGAKAPMVYATQPPAALASIQQRYGETRASLAVETAFAGLTARLLARGFNQFIVAGGETSGTVVQQLGVRSLDIGRSIVPGVPWVRDRDRGLCLALKSGNFGDDNFFLLAQECAQ